MVGFPALRLSCRLDHNQVEQSLEARIKVDRTYKQDIPAASRALEQIKTEFSRFDSKTDWKNLRVQPLLEHARSLERLLRSPQFARETSRLPRGVPMFHSDLVYFRENIKTLKAILELEWKSHSRGPRKSKPRSAKVSRKRKQAL